MRKLILPSIVWLTLLSTTLACEFVNSQLSTPIPTVPPTKTAGAGPTKALPTSPRVAPTVEASPTSIPAVASSTDTPPPGATAAPTVAATVAATVAPTTAATVAGTPVTLLSIRMFSETAGWGIGNLLGDPTDYILRTNDGGNTWKKVTPPEPPGKRATAGFLDLQNAWVIFVERPAAASPASTHVWHTTDGGATWNQSNPVDVNGSEYFDPSDLVFVSAQAGWLLGHVGAGMNHDYVMGFTTSDGGAHWTKVIDPVAS